MAPTTAGSDEDEAGSAILLGALMGGGMGLLSHHIEKTNEDKQIKAASAQWETLKKINATSKKMFIPNANAALKQFGTADDSTTPTYVNPATGTFEIDPLKQIQINLANSLNKSLTLESTAAAASNDRAWYDYNKGMAAASYIHSLFSRVFDVKDVKDLVELDTPLDEANDDQLATGAYLATNRDLLKAYAEEYDALRSSIQAEDTLSSAPEDVQFNNFLIRNLFYLKAQAKALAAIKPTRPEAIEQMSTMIADINAQIEAITKDRAAVKQDYMAEIGAKKALETQLSTLATALKADPQNEELMKEAVTAHYKLQELTQMLGTEDVDFGNGERMLNSSSLPTFNASDSATRDPSLKDEIFYKLGAGRLKLEELRDLLANDASSEEVIDFIRNNDIEPSPELFSALDKVLDLAKAGVAEAEAAVQDMEDKINAEEDPDLQEEMQDLQTPLQEEVRQATTKVNLISDLYQKNSSKLADYQETRRNLSGDPEDVRNYLIRSVATRKLAEISSFIDEAERLGDLFFKEAELRTYLTQAEILSTAFTNRKDIPAPLAGGIAAEVADLIAKLKAIALQIEKNKFNRVAKQEAAMRLDSDTLRSILDINADGTPNTSGSVYNLLAGVFGNKIGDIYKELASLEHPLSFYKVLQELKDKNQAVNMVKHLDIVLATLAKKLKDMLAVGGALDTGIYTNPQKYAPYFVEKLVGLASQFADETSIFYKFNQDKDLTNFIFNLELSKDPTTNNYEGLDTAQTDKLNEVLTILLTIKNLKEAKDFMTSVLDANKFEAELITLTADTA